MKSKQVIVLRKDLNMRKGKMVAQGSHASLKVFFDLSYFSDKRTWDDKEDFIIDGDNMNDAMRDWVKGSFTKICVSVNSEAELLEVYNKAKNANLPCSLIQDAGHTEFAGVPTYTAVAIGPGWDDQIDLITGTLPLL
jgi:PTH2 family peptidyl-tRNA hydrolase